MKSLFKEFVGAAIITAMLIAPIVIHLYSGV
jgi:hypothetical protein